MNVLPSGSVPLSGSMPDVVFCLPKYINNKIITHNSTNPYRIGLYWRCQTSRTAGGITIKFFEIKYNLIKKIFDFCFLKINA